MKVGSEKVLVPRLILAICKTLSQSRTLATCT